MNQSYGPLVGRILISVIFLFSGIGKLADPSGTIAYIAKSGALVPEVGYVAATAIECLGGLAILLGFKTRWAASILFLFTLATALMFHAKFDDPNQTIHFLKNLAMAGGLLFVASYGPGRLSLDARRR